MINSVVATNKYEIPGSLTGLDWREKCIISPRGCALVRETLILFLSETKAYLERGPEEELERERNWREKD